MQNILITGGNGLLANEFKRRISYDDAIFCSRTDLDVTNIDMIRSFIQGRDIKYIINCAANCNAEYLETHPEDSVKINEIAPQNLAIVSNEIGATLIHFSSDYVFDGKKNTPYVETDITNPLSVYGRSKEKSEQYLLNHCDSVVVIRTAWLFSPFGKDFVKTIWRAAQKGNLHVIFDQVGSPSYAGDVAKYVIEILPKLERDTKEIYHLTNEGICSWYDLSCLALREFGIQREVIPIHTNEYVQKAKRPTYSVLDKEKIKKDFGIQIRHFSDALHECIAEIKEK